MDRAGGGPTDAFVVRPDRRAALRLQRRMFASGGVVVVLATYLLAQAEGWAAAYQGVTVVFWAFYLGHFGLLWGRFQAAGTLAEISRSGIRVHVLSGGWAALPWEAVLSVRTDYAGRVVVQPADGVGPGSPGTEWPEVRGARRRAQRRLYIPTRQTDARPEQVRAAIAHLSDGRLPAPS